MPTTTNVETEQNWEDIVGAKTIDDGGYIGDILTLGRAHIKSAKAKGEITNQEAGVIYSSLMTAAIKDSIYYGLNVSQMLAKADTEKAKSINEKIVSGYSITGVNTDGTINWSGPVDGKTTGRYQINKVDIQQGILENQANMVGYEEGLKLEMLNTDLAQKNKMIDQLSSDIRFSDSKKTVMESTRNDQVRMKAAEQFSEFLKYISAANVVPSRQDFENMRELINAVNDGILDTETSADISVTTSEDFQTT
jgi:hypothetical protein